MKQFINQAAIIVPLIVVAVSVIVWAIRLEGDLEELHALMLANDDIIRKEFTAVDTEIRARVEEGHAEHRALRELIQQYHVK